MEEKPSADLILYLPGSLMTKLKPLGKYELLQELGRGGFATVYHARDTHMDREVALKVIHGNHAQDAAFVERFRQEARAAAQLHHPHLITVYDFGEAEGRLFLAMRLISGPSLAGLLQEQGRLSLTEALPLLQQLAEALDFLHRRQLVHRDLKPANILLEGSSPPWQVTLADFGLIRSLENSAQLTQTGSTLGTPAYMAPEQADPKQWGQITPQTDIYALGVVAFELLTGQPPFTADSPIQMMYHHVHSTPPQPSTVDPSLPLSLDKPLLKVLAKAPVDRYPSAGAFVAVLQQAAQAKIHFSSPQPVPSAGPKWVWGAVVGLLILISLIGWGLYEVTSTPALPTEITEPSIVAATPTKTLLSPTFTPTPTETSAPSPGLGSTRTREADGMTLVYVPGGTFIMGSDDGDDDEKPPHPVMLNAFWMDQTEVNNSQFQRFVEATNYTTTAEKTGSGWVFTGKRWDDVTGTNWQHPNGPDSQVEDTHPVAQVSWDDASAYCAWVGGRLPTEAEWEYAARGPENRRYPWGNEFDPANLNASGQVDGFEYTAPVGSYPNGVSWVGVQDMAGNVWEWVADWYDPYPAGTQTNPTGPTSGEGKVMRGGSWGNDANAVRAAYRGGYLPNLRYQYLGFRCVILPSGRNTETPLLPTFTSTTTETTAPTLGIGSTRTREADGMILVYVPGGNFMMGSDTGEVDEKPPHPVRLDAFWLDQTEITNAQYNRCIEAGQCQVSDYTNEAQWNRADYPVVGLSWQNAVDYCQWIGGRLPTEAEWEYAARGPENRIYPWGNEFDGIRLNFCDKNCPQSWKVETVDDGYAQTAPVGHYPIGASWVGAPAIPNLARDRDSLQDSGISVKVSARSCQVGG